MNLAPEDKQGVASGIFSAVKSVSLMFGVSIFETIFSENIPHKMIKTASGDITHTVPQDLLMAAFKKAYFVGIFVLFLAAFFSYVAKKSVNNQS